MSSLHNLTSNASNSALAVLKWYALKCRLCERGEAKTNYLPYLPKWLKSYVTDLDFKIAPIFRG